MVNEWPLVRIEDIQAPVKAAIAIGPFGSRMKSDCYVTKGVPVIRGTNLDQSPRFKGDFVYITAKMADSLKSCNVYNDDLVFPHRGSIGAVGIVPDDKRYVISSSLMKITVDKTQVNPKFLYYFFKTATGKHELLKNASQVGTPGIGQPLSSLKSIEFRKPPLEIQNEIVNYAYSLDQKIQLNRQTNQTLEQMAQALFKSWFVDFDPVMDKLIASDKAIPEELHAHAERRRTQLAQLKNDPDHKPLDADLLALFPDEFELVEQDVGIGGWVPNGWDVQPIAEALEVNPRVKLPKGTIAKFADMKAIPTSGYNIEEIIEKPYSGGAKFENNDVLLARITPCLENGKTALVDFLSKDEVGFGSTEFIVLRGKENVAYGFIACLAREEKFRLHCIQNMVGSSGRQRVQNSCFHSFFLALPNTKTLNNTFESMVENSFKKMSQNTKEVSTLSKLRDTLLPKLISGELRIPEVQA